MLRHILEKIWDIASDILRPDLRLILDHSLG